MTQKPSALTSVRLKFRGADVFLSEGSYVIGRSATSQLVIDDSRVSRHHAKIGVAGTRVTIEDLGSINGVYVNGLRIEGVKTLVDGDRIGIGAAELELKIGAASSERRERSTVETPLASIREELRRSRDPIQPSDSEPALSPMMPFDSEPPTSAAGTQRADVFELVGPIAQKALTAGRSLEAENILNAHLGKVLDDYRKGRPVPVGVRDAALTYSLQLATALGSGKWLNFAFDLLLKGRVLIDARLAARLVTTMSRVDAVDVVRVRAYVDMLREMPQSFEKVRAVHQGEELLRSVTARKR